jgi:CHAT domain-containing protein/Flp pilus assembly protein TadD
MPYHGLPKIFNPRLAVWLLLSLLWCWAGLIARPVLGGPDGQKFTKSQARDRAAAQRVFQEAEQLRAQRTADSLGKAVEKYNQALALFQTAGDRFWEAATLNNIGLVYDALGEKQKAFDYYNQALPILRAVGNRSGEAITLNNIGSVYNALGEKQKALDYYAQALLIRRAVGDRSGEATTLNNFGVVYDSLGEKQKALDYYTQALLIRRAVGNRSGEANTLNNIGVVYNALGEKQKALDYYNQALPICRAVGDRSGEATTLNNIGSVYNALGEKQKALDYYTQALPISRAVGNRSGEANTLNNFGVVYDALGEKQKALDYYTQVLLIRRAVGDRSGEAATLNNIGRVYDALGEKQKALDYCNQALPIWRTVGDRSGEATTLNNIGGVYDALGDKQKALDYYNQALPIRRAVGDRDGEAGTLNNIGVVYIALGERQKALDYYSQALPICRAVGDRSGEATTLNNIGGVYDALGEKQKALDYYNQALPIHRAVGNRSSEATTLNNLGMVYNSLGEKQKALDYYNQALPIFRAVGDRSLETTMLGNSALVQRDLGDPVEARALIEEALRIIEYLRAQINSEELRASYFSTVQGYYQFYIDLLMRLHRQHPSEGFDGLALGASERARARSLLELLSEAGADIHRGIEPELLERERSLQQRLKDKEAEQVKLLSGKYTNDQAAALKKEIEDLLSQYQDVEGEIRAKSPRYAALTQPQPLVLKEIQQLLDPESMLLEYSLGEERSFLWSVTPTSLTNYELPKGVEIEKVARRFLAIVRVQSPVPESPATQEGSASKSSTGSPANASQDVPQELSRILLGPVAAQLGTKRLIIVADGALQYVPFAALPAPDRLAQPSQESLPPLITEHEIVNLPSASTLAVLRRQLAGRVPAPKALAVLADPVFDADDDRVKQDASHVEKKVETSESSSVSSHLGGGTQQGREASLAELALTRSVQETGFGARGLGLERLKATRDEAGAIIILAPATSRLEALDFSANKVTATGTDLSQYRIVHFATHGLLNSGHPELSGLVLSLVDERGEAQDGFLRLNDIFNLNLPADLVVLSACQSGLGKEIKGEGLVGLTRGFMYAGAPRVVVSLWSVNDQATAELMKRFYLRMLKNGQRPAAALRAAQIEMLKEPQWRAPYFWAAFVLQGEWK